MEVPRNAMDGSAVGQPFSVPGRSARCVYRGKAVRDALQF